MLDPRKLQELDNLMDDLPSRLVIKAIRRTLEEVDLPERGPKGNKGNQDRVDTYTSALLEELREIDRKQREKRQGDETQCQI